MQAKQITKIYSMLFAIALTAILSGCGGGEKIVASDTADVSVTEVPALETKQITVHFDYKKTAVNPAADQKLTLIAQQLKNNPSYQIELVGHTDGVASALYNMRLSQQRVEAVRDFLAVHGIAAERMTIAWKGKTRPVAANSTEAGRAKNRRTEVTLRPTMDTPASTAMLDPVEAML